MDPLGLISGSNAASRFNPNQSSSGKADPSQPGFKDVLLQNLDEVNKLQVDANRAIEDYKSGKRDDFESVILATQQADTAFHMLQSLRNKVVEAYDEVKQIRV